VINPDDVFVSTFQSHERTISFPTALRNKVKNNQERANLYQQWDKEALEIYKEYIPKGKETQDKERLFKFLSKKTTEWFKGSKLHIFGSSGNRFGTKSSDIDVCLEVTDAWSSGKANPQKTAVFKLTEKLRRERDGGRTKKLRFSNIQPIAHARVPIVKLTETATGVDVDVCINNMLATRNTLLLKTYADCDVRVRQLGVLIKMWAKVRGVKASDQGTLSSYAWILMAIAYCQRRGIVPSLQDSRLFPGGVVDAPTMCRTARNGDLDTSFVENVEAVQDGNWQTLLKPDNRHTCSEEQEEEEEEEENMLLSSSYSFTSPSLGELLFGFFWFYAYEFDHKQACSTTRYVPSMGHTKEGGYGQLLNKRKRWGLKTKKWRLSVEDPFEDWHDLGQVVNREGQIAIENELKRAADLLARGGTMKQLLKKAPKRQSAGWGDRGVGRVGRGGGRGVGRGGGRGGGGGGGGGRGCGGVVVSAECCYQPMSLHFPLSTCHFLYLE
jgi:DNA polymerase sigma